MPTLSVRDVPAPLLAMLRQRAEKNHRSLQKEVLVILEESLAMQRAEALAAIEQGWRAQPSRPSASAIESWLAEGRT